MSEAVSTAAQATLQAPRDVIERQHLVVARDLALGSEAIFNPMRAKRVPARTNGPHGDEKGLEHEAGSRCFLCYPPLRTDGRPDLAEDEFGAVEAADGRVRASANWSRSASVSGIVYGDHSMHDVLSLSRDEFCGLFEGAASYIAASRSTTPQPRYFMVFVNGGPRSAGTVSHAHAQVVGRADRHFAVAERIATNAPREYWQTSHAVHADLGLAAEFAGGQAWASIAAIKERDVTAVSDSLSEGAAMMHTILQTLQRHGTNSYSLAAILSPRFFSGDPVPDRFRLWPPVVWRLVDRGDVHARHADIGCLELFGSNVVATDPFEVAGWLRQIASDTRGQPEALPQGPSATTPCPPVQALQEHHDAGHIQ